MSQQAATNQIETSEVESPEAEPEFDIEFLRKAHRFNAELCKTYPPQFLHFLADHAADLVDTWMKEHEAPEEILDLAYNAKNLEQLARDMELDRTSRVELEMGFEQIPETVSLIVKLGGKFSGPAGIIP
jgi:hypothetical protein